MRSNLAISAVVHVALLIWMLTSLAGAKLFDIAPPHAVMVDIVSPDEVPQMRNMQNEWPPTLAPVAATPPAQRA